MRMPWMESAFSPTSASRRSVSRLLRPASTRTLVRSVATKVQLPELPLARTATRTLITPPGAPGRASALEHFPGELQCVNAAEDRQRNQFSAEELVSDRRNIVRRDALDFSNHFIQGEELSKI